VLRYQLYNHMSSLRPISASHYPLYTFSYYFDYQYTARNSIIDYFKAGEPEAVSKALSFRIAPKSPKGDLLIIRYL